IDRHFHLGTARAAAFGLQSQLLLGEIEDHLLALFIGHDRCLADRGEKRSDGQWYLDRLLLGKNFAVRRIAPFDKPAIDYCPIGLEKSFVRTQAYTDLFLRVLKISLHELHGLGGNDVGLAFRPVATMSTGRSFYDSQPPAIGGYQARCAVFQLPEYACDC